MTRRPQSAGWRASRRSTPTRRTSRSGPGSRGSRSRIWSGRSTSGPWSRPRSCAGRSTSWPPATIRRSVWRAPPPGSRACDRTRLGWASRQLSCTDGSSSSPTNRARSLRWRRSSRRYCPTTPSPERCRPVSVTLRSGWPRRTAGWSTSRRAAAGIRSPRRAISTRASGLLAPRRPIRTRRFAWPSSDICVPTARHPSRTSANGSGSRACQGSCRAGGPRRSGSHVPRARWPDLYDLADGLLRPATRPRRLGSSPAGTAWSSGTSGAIVILPDAVAGDVLRPKNGDFLPSFTVDGYVAGTWSVATTPKEAVARDRAVGRRPASARTELTEEAERLVRFIGARSVAPRESGGRRSRGG